MKIMFICDTMGSGGAERVIATLSNGFVERGNNVSILMLSKEAKGSFYNLHAGVKLLNLNFQSGGFFKKVHAIKNFVASEGPDIVISFLSYVCIYTWWALRHTKIPYIVSERNDPNQRGKLKQFLLNKSFRRAAGCVFQTEDAQEWYLKKNKLNSVIIQNPVNLDFVPEKIGRIKNQILYVGRLNKQKNCFMLLKAFKLFSIKHPEFTLKMYGDGPLRDDLIDLISNLRLSNKVCLLSSSKTWQKDEYYSAMFVLSSRFEGMPNVLAEALSLGIPSVSTDCTIGGPKELKKCFPELLVLSEEINSESFSLAMEKALQIQRKTPEIPEILQKKYIINMWIKFIEGIKKK